MLRFLIDRFELNLLKGMSPEKALDAVAEEQGLHKDGKVYKYLVQRIKEENNGQA